MEWIEISIDIEVVHVFGPLQGFDQGDTQWKSSNFPRDHNCPAGQRYFEHFTQRKSARKRHYFRERVPTRDLSLRPWRLPRGSVIRESNFEPTRDPHHYCTLRNFGGKRFLRVPQLGAPTPKAQIV
jgi:hypothetical protein